MRVVHIGYRYGTCDTGGAAIAATRLHLALLKAGIESHFVCCEQCEDGPNVHVLPRGSSRSVQTLLIRLSRFCAWRIYRTLRKSHSVDGPLYCSWGLSLHIVPMFGLKRLLRQLNPDVVHVHWMIHDSVSFRQVARIGFPLVISLHDLYMINAIDPAWTGDRRFLEGFTRTNSNSYERWLVARKRRITVQAHPNFVGPSEWVCGLCRSSVIGQGAPVFRVSNIIDTRFRDSSHDRIAQKRMVVLFGAKGGRSDVNKGWPELEAALDELPMSVAEDVEVRVFGGESFESYETGNGVLVRSLGSLKTQSAMQAAYDSADVLAMPSRSETQGLTKCEALLCGLPVLVFDRTACAEGIRHQVDGWVSPDGDVADYARGIAYFHRLFASGALAEMRSDVAARAASAYAPESVVKHISEVYRSAMSGRPRS